MMQPIVSWNKTRKFLDSPIETELSSYRERAQYIHHVKKVSIQLFWLYDLQMFCFTTKGFLVLHDNELMPYIFFFLLSVKFETGN